MTKRTSLLLPLVLLAACESVPKPKTTSWVSSLEFTPLVLPTRDDWRGHTLLAGLQLPDQTTCFNGTPHDPQRIAHLNHKYTSADLKRLIGDWGSLFTFKGTLSAGSTLTVRLKDAAEQYWTNMEPSFNDACLDEDDSFTPNLDVIVSVLRVEDVYVSYASTDVHASTLTMHPALLAAGHPAVPTLIEGGRDLTTGADELLIATSAVMGYKTVRWKKMMQSWPVILEYSGQPTFAAGYSFLLKPISVTLGGASAANVDIANPEAKVSLTNVLLTPGAREIVKPGKRRVDYIVVEKMDGKRVRLVLRRTVYAPKS